MITVLRHARLVCMNDRMDYYPDGYIAFEKDTILETGDEQNFHLFPGAQETDMHGDIVLPAFINCHTHLGMTAFRSLGDDMPDRLNRFLFPLENTCMTAELVYTSSRISIAEMLLSGTATALDMYYFEEQVAKSAQDMHFRLWAGETLLDSPHCDAENFDAGLKRIQKLLKYADPMIRIICAPHAPYSVSSANLKRVIQFARENDMLWSMHVSELVSENETCRKKSGCSPIRYLADMDLLNDRLIAAHCIFADDEDLSLLAGKGVSVAHCPVSNAKAAKGVARIRDMIKSGTTVTLGTDGPASGNTLDMFTQMKTAVILQKNLLKDRSAMPAAEILKTATCNGGKALRAPIGILTPGYKADILVLSTQDSNMVPVHDVYSVIVYSAQPQNVKTLWVNGELTVKNHSLCLTKLQDLIEDFTQESAEFNTEIKKRG
jgi:5-methylthioadenosine/S-adenosylhomocysteine deaminase